MNPISTRYEQLFSEHPDLATYVIGMEERQRNLEAEIKRQREEYERQIGALEQEAYTDPLTGIYNRRRFLERLEK